MVGTVPRSLVDWMRPFVRCFTGATWDHVLVLVAGALLSHIIAHAIDWGRFL